MKRFPGLVTDWAQLSGRTVEAIAPLGGKPGAVVLVFTDGSFALAPPLAPEPWEIGEGLKQARSYLVEKHQQAYAEYDRLAQKDRDALRAARLEKILGAIQNNLEQIPELKDRLRALVKEWT
ncbi:MAG: hypothetical protein AB7G48_08050 [Nitrospiraceae bacterium]